MSLEQTELQIGRILQQRQDLIPKNIFAKIRFIHDNNLLVILTKRSSGYGLPEVTPTLEEITDSCIHDLLLSDDRELQAMSALKLIYIYRLSPHSDYDELMKISDLFEAHNKLWPDQSDLLKNQEIPVINSISLLIRRLHPKP